MICNKCQTSYEAPEPIYNKDKERYEQNPKRKYWLCEACNEKDHKKKRTT